MGTKSCTRKQACLMRRLSSGSPIRRNYLNSDGLRWSHDQSVYAGRRWNTRERRKQWLLPSENSRFGVARRQGWSACDTLIRGTLAAPHMRRSSSNQSLAVLDACFVGNALEGALADANRPLKQRHPGHTTAVLLGIALCPSLNSVW